MKKLLALLMAVAVTFQLVTPVFADTEGTEETTAPTEAVVETKAPTEAPAEETTAPTEETTAPTEETSAPTEATEETEEATEATEETVEDIALFADDGDVIASGECGENGNNLTWVLTEDGTLTISGSGNMRDYSPDTPAPWYTYRSRIIAIVLESGVTSIGHSAFLNCSGLTTASIPDGVTSISETAFSECSGLTAVTIPESVESIGNMTFDRCSSLRNITVDEGNRNYTSVDGVLFNKERTMLVKYPAEHATAYQIPEGVTSINWFAFGDCYRLTSLTIPEGVTSIGVYAFIDCSSLRSMRIPGSVTYIGLHAFVGCTGLSSLSYGGSLGALKRMTSGTGLPTSCTLRGETSDLDNGVCGANLTWVLGTNYVLTISGRGEMKTYGTAYYNEAPWYTSREQITEVVLEDGITNIGNCAFRDCAKLVRVTVPESVTSIGSYAFSGCSELKHVYYGGSDLQWKEIQIGSNDPLTNATIHYATLHIHKLQAVPEVAATCTQDGTNAYYVCSDCSKAFRDAAGTVETTREAEIIPANGHTEVIDKGYDATCTETGLSDGRHCSVCEQILEKQEVIPAFGHDIAKTEAAEPTYWAVGNNAYYTCSRCGKTFKDANGETETTVEDETLAVLPSIAHGTCGDNLTWVLTEDGTLTISGSGEMENYTDSSVAPWYSNRTKILSAVVEPGVESVGNYAFYACLKLASVSLPDGVKRIGPSAFQDCTRLTAAEIPDGVTSIGYRAFYGCSGLTSVTIPEGVTSIGSSAFSGCRSLTSVTIPEGVTSIDYYTFEDCSSLTSVTIPESVTSIGNSAFSGCSGLTSVTIPEGVTSIGSSAFSGCRSLTSVTIPEGVTSIGNSTFSSCRSLTSVTIPESVTSIDGNAFSGCSSLTSVTIPEGVTSIGGSVFYGCRSLTSVTIPEGVTQHRLPSLLRLQQSDQRDDS